MKESVLMTVTCFNEENDVKEFRLDCQDMIGAARMMLTFVSPKGYWAVGYFVSVEGRLV